MVMDQFVTTYRKDYLWPYVRTFGIRPEPSKLFQVQLRDPNQLCACHCLEKPKSPSDQPTILGPLALSEESWSRQGPMGPLLNPKMYPAKIAEKPESSPTSNFNQPNVFLQKLQEKYPFVYECLRQAPPNDMISRINRDRLRTTYQVDFCKMMEYPSAPYDEMLRAANMEGSQPCTEPVNLPGDWYRPGRKEQSHGASQGAEGGMAQGGSSTAKNHGRSSQFQQADKSHGEDRVQCKLPYGSATVTSSEYQDGVSKLGAYIIKERLHRHPRPPGRLADAFTLNKNPVKKD